MTRYGLLLEVRIKGQAHYLLADLPPQHMGDLKGAIIQERFSQHCTSPEALFEAIPDLKPSVDKLFEPIEYGWVKPGVPITGHFRILNMEHLLALPKFDWEVIYKTPEVVEHGGIREAVEHSRATGGDLQTIEPTFVPHVPGVVTLRRLDDPDPWV